MSWKFWRRRRAKVPDELAETAAYLRAIDTLAQAGNDVLLGMLKHMRDIGDPLTDEDRDVLAGKRLPIQEVRH